jgi:plasmid replication initiation protein
MSDKNLNLDVALNDEVDNEILPSVPITLSPYADPTTLTVTRSKELVASQTALTLRQRKVLNACISQINPLGSYPDGITVELTDSDLSLLTQIKKNHLYEFIEKTAIAFHSIPIIKPGKEEDDISYINIAEESTYSTKDRCFRVKFHKSMEKELINLRRYSSPKLQVLNGFANNYSMCLYDLLFSLYIAKRGGKQIFKVKLDDLFFSLGLVAANGEILKPSLVNKFSDFRRKVLVPSVDSVNEGSPFNVSFETERIGRKVGLIIFSVSQKANVVAHDDPKEYLSQFGISSQQYQDLEETYGYDRVRANVAYLRLVISANAERINNKYNYLDYLLKNNIAALPDLANPYSELYRNRGVIKTFVKNLLTPIWWKIPASIRSEIEDCESQNILSNPGIYSYFSLYEMAYQKLSREELLSSYTAQDLLNSILNESLIVD